MSANRAFKNLAALRDRFVDPQPEEQGFAAHEATTPLTEAPVVSIAEHSASIGNVPAFSMPSRLEGKVDGRRQRKVLKTPSVSLSVSVRRENHEDISSMLFARKSTWIALLDELLMDYVQQAKNSGRFPK